MRLLAPLRLRGFRILWTGMAISLLGDGVTLVAIAWQAYQLSDAPTALGIIMMAMSIPHILLLPFGGVISDRFERRWVMLGADMVRGTALAALGVLSLSGTLQIWHMAAIAALYGAGNAFFGPAFDAMVPDLVPEALLAQANSLDQFVRPIAARLAGPALGGWIIASVGPGWAFLANAATFLVSIACLLRIGSTRMPRAGGPTAAASAWTEIREGLAYVRSCAWLWATFLAATLAYLIFLGPSEVLLPYIIKNEIGGTAGELGMVYSAGGLGAVVAATLMAQYGIPRRNMTFIFVSWSTSTLAVAGYGLAHATWQVMLAGFVFNTFESAGLIVWLTTKQSLIPTRLLGRVSSLDWLISTALMPISYALAGPVSTVFGARSTLVAAGILGSVVTLAFLFLPAVRSIEGDKSPSSGDESSATPLMQS